MEQPNNDMPAGQAAANDIPDAGAESQASLGDFYQDMDAAAAKQPEPGKQPPAQDNTEPGGEKEVTGLGDDEPPAGEAKEPEKAPDKEPDKPAEDEYQPQFPDGFSVDKQGLDDFKAFAKEAKLTPEQFQKAVDMQVKFDQRMNAARQEERARLEAEFVATLKADPDFGGSNYKQTMDAANWAFRKFGDPELLGELREWGVSKHHHVIKLLARVGLSHREGRSPVGSPPAEAAAQSEPDSLEDFYGYMDKENS